MLMTIFTYLVLRWCCQNVGVWGNGWRQKADRNHQRDAWECKVPQRYGLYISPLTKIGGILFCKFESLIIKFWYIHSTGHKLPENIIACPDIVDTASDADVLIFVLPHQFIKRACQPLSKYNIIR